MMYKYPRNYNRRMLINMADKDAAEPDWRILAAGIQSRSNSIDESTEDFYYFDGRGTAETEITGQKISVAFTGHRAVGDIAQDYLLDDVLYDLDKRVVDFVDYLDTIPEGKPNGRKGTATLQITDWGSGDANSRQTIGFTLNFNGKPEKGTMTEEDGKYTWVPLTQEEAALYGRI